MVLISIMNFNLNINRYFFLVFILFLYSVFLSLLLPARDWETDYGSYYSLSMFLDSENILYENMFSHSGPFYFFFIKIFGYLFGWGWKSSIIIYAITNFIFFSSILHLCKKLDLNFFETLIILILLFSFQKYFGTNICLQNFFNSILVLFSLNLLLFITNNFKKNYFYISIFFFSLLILTRIDGIIYSFLIIISYIYYIVKNKIEFKYILNDFIISVIIFTIIFLFFKIYFNYSFSSYFYHNIIFNLNYGDLNSTLGNFTFIIDQIPKKLSLALSFFTIVSLILICFKEKKSLKTLIPLIVLYFVLFQIYQFEIDNNYLFFSNLFLIALFLSFILNENKIYIYLFFSVIFYLISIFIFNYSGSHKLYHSAMFHPSYILLFISTIFFIKTVDFKIFKYFTFFILIFLIADQYKKHVRFYNQEIIKNENISFKNNFTNFFYDETKILNNELITLQKKENLKVICGRGWINIFSETKTKGNIYDWWYFTYIHFNTDYFNKDYEYFINGNLGKKFIIDRTCVKDKINKSNKLKNIIENSTLIKELTFFKNTYQLRNLNL